MSYNNIFGIDEKLCKIAEETEKACSGRFDICRETAEYNGNKVLAAFINNRVSEQCFYGSTGYGYGDVGRDTLDKIYAEVFGCEDALVRHNLEGLSVPSLGVAQSSD